MTAFITDGEETTVASPAGGYLPEGNEEGILHEYIFTLSRDTLLEGLVFEQADTDATVVSGR